MILRANLWFDLHDNSYIITIQWQIISGVNSYGFQQIRRRRQTHPHRHRVDLGQIMKHGYRHCSVLRRDNDHQSICVHSRRFLFIRLKALIRMQSSWSMPQYNHVLKTNSMRGCITARRLSSMSAIWIGLCEHISDHVSRKRMSHSILSVSTARLSRIPDESRRSASPLAIELSHLDLVVRVIVSESVSWISDWRDTSILN